MYRQYRHIILNGFLFYVPEVDTLLMVFGLGVFTAKSTGIRNENNQSQLLERLPVHAPKRIVKPGNDILVP